MSHHLTTSTSQRTGTEAARRLVLFAKMLEGFRDRPSSPESVAKTYVEKTADLPFDALSEAVRRFERDAVEGHNPAFAPSSAQIYGLASQIAARSERVTAPPRLPPPEPTAAVGLGDKFAELLGGLKGVPADLTAPRTEGAEKVKRWRERMRDGEV